MLVFAPGEASASAFPMKRSLDLAQKVPGMAKDEEVPGGRIDRLDSEIHDEDKT
jgi:hypothetical protein